MGFLSIFKKQDFKAVLIAELKQDKDRLLLENTNLKEEITSLNNQLIQLKQTTLTSTLTSPNKSKSLYGKALSPSEAKILNIYEKQTPQNINELSDLTKIKASSLYVIVNRIKKKGFDISF